MFTLSRPHFWPDFDESWSECLSWQYLGQIRIWVMKGKQTRSNLRQLLCILVKLRPSNLVHLYNLVCGVELWHFITLNWPFDLLLHFKALVFRFRPPRCRLFYLKWWKKGTLKNLQVSVPGPSGPSCLNIQWTWQFRVIDSSGSTLEKDICF